MRESRQPAQSGIDVNPSAPRWGAGLLLALAALAAYSNSLQGEFLFDDLPSIVDNESIRSLWPLGPVLWPPRDGSTVEARPLLNLSLALNYAWGGLNVGGYHAVNVAIHVLAGLTLLGVVRRTLLLPGIASSLRKASSGLALTVALIWTLHPLQTESVAYIVQRAESLMGLFYLLTLYCAIRAATSPVPGCWNAAAIAACAAGMASKEVMVSAPLIVLLYDRVFVYSSWAQAFARRKGLYVGLAATWVLLVGLVMPSATRSGSAGWGQGVSAWEYLLTQADAIVRYLRLSLWPDRLVLDYGDSVVRHPGQVVPQGLLVLFLLGATAWSWWRCPWVGFLGTWFFAALAPSSSIVPVVTQTTAEHRMYLPLAPLVTLLVVACYHFWCALKPLRPPWIPSLAVIGVALLLAVRTYVRNDDYRTQFAAWEANMRDWPANQRPRLGMADRLMRLGEVPHAIQIYTEALQRAPNDAAICNSRGVAYQKMGQHASAVSDHTQAIQLQPDWLAYNNRGVALRYLGRYREALDDHTKAIELNPGSAQAWYSRGIVQRLAGQPDLALADFTKALKLQPDMAQAFHDRGALHQTAGNWEAALSDYTQALKIAPDNPLPWVNRGSVNQQLGRMQAALDDYSRALVLDPRDGPTHLNRAACYLALGRLELAQSNLRDAQRLGIAPDPALLNQFQNAIEKRRGSPP